MLASPLSFKTMCLTMFLSFRTYLRSLVAASVARGTRVSASPFHKHLLLQSGSRRNGRQHRVQAVADVLSEAPLPELEVREKVRQEPLPQFRHITVFFL